MYWVHWNTRKARLARKSLADRRPATGRSWKPVRSARDGRSGLGGQQAGPSSPGPARTLQEARDVLQLGDAVLAVAAEALQQPEGLQVLAAGVGGVQALERAVDLLPASQGSGHRPPWPPGSAAPRHPLRSPSCGLPTASLPLGGDFAGGFGEFQGTWDREDIPGDNLVFQALGSPSSTWPYLSCFTSSRLPGSPCAQPCPCPASCPQGLTRWQSPLLCTPHGEWVHHCGGSAVSHGPLPKGRGNGGAWREPCSARAISAGGSEAWGQGTGVPGVCPGGAATWPWQAAEPLCLCPQLWFEDRPVPTFGHCTVDKLAGAKPWSRVAAGLDPKWQPQWP